MLGSERMYVDAVLGLSMTATSVGLVLVEGQGADGATMERDAVDVRRGMRSADEAVAVVHRMEAAADDRGVRLHSIGVTWSDDADDQASTLLRSLAQSGFLNVVPIRMPEAAEALARGIADVIGRRTTAVCVIEPDAVFVLIVHSGALGSVRTAMNRAIATEQRLISWLSSIFARAEWTPEALVVVGSAGGFDDLLPLLEDALEVPVFSPDEAELALARGAALVSTSRVEVDTEFGSQGFAVPDRGTSRPAQGRDVWSSSQLGAASGGGGDVRRVGVGGREPRPHPGRAGECRQTRARGRARRGTPATTGRARCGGSACRAGTSARGAPARGAAPGGAARRRGAGARRAGFRTARRRPGNRRDTAGGARAARRGAAARAGGAETPAHPHLG